MLYPLLTFLVVMLFVTAMSIRVKAPPFFTLLFGALFFGLLSGMTPDQVVLAAINGLGKIFAIFAVIILCGAVIAKTLHAQGLIEGLVSDLRQRTGDTRSLSGLAGYLFALPATCCITAFVMLTPILGNLGGERSGKDLLYLAAVGSVLSYTLIYPTPVVIPLFSGLGSGASPLLFDLVAVPLSLLLLGGVVFAFRARAGRGMEGRLDPGEKRADNTVAGKIHWKAWAPFLAILAAIPLFSVFFSFSHESMIQCIMLAGLLVCMALATPVARTAGLLQGTRHAGIIMFDICGAGAFGSVIVASGFPEGVFPGMVTALPLVLIPFVFTAAIQAAQGSRVVSAVISSQVLAGTAVSASMHPIPLILSVAAGTCVISYLSDPFFWLLQRTTGGSIWEVVRNYTLPLFVCGMVVLAVAVGLEAVLMGG
ncbi:MAG: putative transporter [Methanoregulaceae archaeon PtaB.Bin152]|nr:MAG: putative transporter [Methanoregulaceae archaeon PtaB.Bin152]